MYSALKVDGQPLYKRARAGEEVERSARPVHIHHFDLLDYAPGEAAEISVDVLCSKGTYIRALAEDLGAALNLPAHVKTLRRTQAGPFGLTNAVTLAQLEAVVDAGSEDGLDATAAACGCEPHSFTEGIALRSSNFLPAKGPDSGSAKWPTEWYGAGR
jgi:tRNA pseudouridine55 synthase